MKPDALRTYVSEARSRGVRAVTLMIEDFDAFDAENQELRMLLSIELQEKESDRYDRLMAEAENEAME